MRGALRALGEALLVAGFVAGVALLLHGAGGLGVRLGALAVQCVGAALLWRARDAASARGLALLAAGAACVALGAASGAVVALCAVAGGAAGMVAARDRAAPGERFAVGAVGVALVVLAGAEAWKRWGEGPMPPPPVALAQALPREQPRCPDGMVYIAGGRFQMGSPDGEGGNDEHPQHEEVVAEFCMDRTEVSVRAFRACVERGTCRGETTTTYGSGHEYCNFGRAERGDHPINCVDWVNASAYCRSVGARLPTEVEWEFAARGTEGRTYAWGNQEPDGSRANLCGRECDERFGLTWRDEFFDTAPVDSMPNGATPGTQLHHMTGNVWEWVEDIYQADAYARRARGEHLRARETSPPSDASLTEPRVLRGGAWLDFDASIVRAAFRYWVVPRVRNSVVGFRCARGIR